MDELSSETLKILELVKGGNSELVKQLYEGDPTLIPDSNDNKLTNEVFKYLFPGEKGRSNWYSDSEYDYTIAKWILYWSQFITI